MRTGPLQGALGHLCLTFPTPPACLASLQRMFAPALPSDLLVNVYINLNKLCLTVYQLHTLQPSSTKVSRGPASPPPRTPSPPPTQPEPNPLLLFPLELPPCRWRSAPQPWGHVVSTPSRRGALEHPPYPNPLFLRGWGATIRISPLSRQ